MATQAVTEAVSTSWSGTLLTLLKHLSVSKTFILRSELTSTVLDWMSHLIGSQALRIKVFLRLEEPHCHSKISMLPL